MFEKEIKFISDFTLNKVKNLGSSFTFKKLSAAGIHPAIYTYISAELDFLIYTDRKKLLENSMFDYSGKSISEYLNKIGSEIKQNKLISYEDIKELIHQAVSFNVNYVVRPKWSITKLIYNDLQYVSVEEMERMLSYIYYYDYIKNVLSAYLSKRKVLQLTLTEFDLILNKVDRELFKANSEELINNALISIGDFFNIGGVDKNKISVQAVEILLKEKNLTDYLMKLHRAIPNGSKKKYDIEDIKNVFYSATPIEPDSISGYDVENIKITEEKPGTEIVEEENISIEDEIINAIGIDDLSGEETVKRELPESLTEDSDFDEMLPIEDEFLVEEKEELIVDKPEAEPADDEMMKRSVDEFDVEKEPVSQDKEIKQGDEQPESKISSEDRSVLEDELNELLEKAISFDEEIPEEIFEKQPENLEEETPSSGNEEGTDNAAETAEKKSGQGDDLLSFYERELAAMSDELSLTQKQTEKTDTQVSVEDSGPEDILQEEKVKDEDKARKEDVDITEEDEFDLSIFEKIGEEEALKKDEAPPEENEETVSVKDKQLPVIEDENVKSASTDEEHFIEEESEPGDLPRSKELFSKEIVDEMIDDFFKDNNIEETKSTEQSIDLLAEESLTEMVNESPENLFDADDEKAGTEEPEEIDLINSKIDKLDVKNEISDVIEDIDNLLEEPDGAALDLPEIPDEKFTEPVSDGTAAEETEQETVPESSSDDFQFASTEDLDFEPEPEIKDEETKEITGEVKKDEQEEVTFESTEYTPQQSANEIPVRQKDMFTYLKKKEIKKIISNVFGGDDEDFVTTVERISGCNTYKEATEILKDVFFSYRVSPYSKEAVILTNAVSNFFRQV